MFKKEKSKTLKFLNFLYIIGMVGALITLVSQVINIIIPENYTSSSPYYYEAKCYSSSRANCIGDSVKAQSVDFRPIGCTILSMLCASAVVFVCNKYIKYFSVEKSSGLKLLTALAALSIVSVTSSLFSGIVYGALSDEHFGMNLIVAVALCIFSAIAPLLADHMHILDTRHNRWLDYISAVLLASLVGTSTALVNSLIYLPVDNCTYYCDQNASTRTIVYQILAIIILVAAIATVRYFSRKELNGKGTNNQQKTATLPPEAPSVSTPEVTPEVTPEATPEAAPEATSEVTPEATPEAAPEATPETPPED